MMPKIITNAMTIDGNLYFTRILFCMNFTNGCIKYANNHPIKKGNNTPLRRFVINPNPINVAIKIIILTTRSNVYFMFFNITFVV